MIEEIESMRVGDDLYDAKIRVLGEQIKHHVKEEEEELFPEVRERLGRNRLLDLGDEMRTARSTVPSRPHPYAPDEPPGNAIVGGAVAVIDRARNAGKKVVDRVRDEIPTL